VHKETYEWVDAVAENCEGRRCVAEPVVFNVVVQNESEGDVVELSRSPRHHVAHYYCYHCIYNVHLLKSSKTRSHIVIIDIV